MTTKKTRTEAELAADATMTEIKSRGILYQILHPGSSATQDDGFRVYRALRDGTDRLAFAFSCGSMEAAIEAALNDARIEWELEMVDATATDAQKERTQEMLKQLRTVVRATGAIRHRVCAIEPLLDKATEADVDDATKLATAMLHLLEQYGIKYRAEKEV